MKAGTVGQSYNFQVQCSGGGPPYSWSIVLGKLPPGVSMTAATGMLTGTPTQPGNYSFTLKVADSTYNQTFTATASLGLAVDPLPLTIVTPNLPYGKVGVPYQIQLQATGGTTPYTWSVIDGAFAPGVQLNAMTGEISGTPIEAGTYSVTIQVMDSSSPQNIARLILSELPSRQPANNTN